MSPKKVTDNVHRPLPAATDLPLVATSARTCLRDLMHIHHLPLAIRGRDLWPPFGPGSPSASVDQMKIVPAPTKIAPIIPSSPPSPFARGFESREEGTRGQLRGRYSVRKSLIGAIKW